MTPENEQPQSNIVDQVDIGLEDKISVLQRSREWAGKHKWQLAIGGIATSACLTFMSDSRNETLQEAADHIPAVVVGMVAMEAMWIGGAGMMAVSVGDKIKNPLKIKAQFPEIAKKANDSKLFTAGLWTNTVGAVGEFVIPAAVVCGKLPPEAWGVLGPSLVDLGITVAIRKAILQGVRSAGETKDTNPATEL